MIVFCLLIYISIQVSTDFSLVFTGKRKSKYSEKTSSRWREGSSHVLINPRSGNMAASVLSLGHKITSFVQTTAQNLKTLHLQ